jgi:DNA-binding PucR family transcriptional regulator
LSAVDGNPFLRLLVEEAPTEAFDRPVEEAREAGATAEELERLQADRVRALQLRATLQERRRREVELAALNETASDLTMLRDVGLVLQAIVRRARSLLGTDTSYLTLIDEEHGDTYMRVTEGTSNPAFADLRLELGTGLGGLVAQTKSPYATANYIADERFAHTGTIDSAVGGEGLTAILGVPILLGERVIGVLFAADRRERPFAQNEIALLSSLAAHAAVAIENARLFGEAQDALRELNAANTAVREHSKALERAAAAHERLTRIVLAGGGVDAVAGAVAELLHGEVLITDATGQVLAAAGGAAPLREPALSDLLDEALATGRSACATLDADDRTLWVAPIVAGSQQLGGLALAGGPLAQADQRTLERAGHVTALLLLNQRAAAEAEQRVRGELLGDVLAEPRRDADSLRQRARLVGADLEQPHAVVVVDPGDVGPHRGLPSAAARAAEAGGLAAVHDGDIVLLLPRQRPADAAQEAVKQLSDALGTTVTAGGSGPAAGPGEIAEAHADARRCLRLLQALGRTGQAATAEELGAFGLLFGHAGRAELERFVRTSIGGILDYDRDRGTRLLETLATYFRNHANLARTAEALHIHVNTLYQRLDRIAQLLGPTWQDPDRALQLHLAVRMHELADAADG